MAFIAIAYAGAWLFALPMWFSGQGLRFVLAQPLLIAIMFTPSLATFLVVQFISPLQDKSHRTGLWLGPPGNRWQLFWLMSWLGMPALVIAAPFVGALFGLYPLDVQHFSGYVEQVQSSPSAPRNLTPDAVRVLLLIQFLGLMVSPVLNAVLTFGEEWGWRGYLLPRLLPLGQWRALLASGVVWGLWHTPIVLLGYNYPQHPHLGVLFMTVTSVIMGVLIGWTRLATASIWPAVIAHASLNGSAGVIYLLRMAGKSFDSTQVGITGWTGWILPLVVIGVLVALRLLPVRNAYDEKWSS